MLCDRFISNQVMEFPLNISLEKKLNITADAVQKNLSYSIKLEYFYLTITRYSICNYLKTVRACLKMLCSCVQFCKQFLSVTKTTTN